ncbi:hypothetical protein SAMN05216338_107317 [Bradyrhizobium sp. Rc2d]|uniref:hypothetical protein n=1 Tax=Bradyrhizobium sp. Rc2d TaxID=1855321 RepID=UPI00089278DF|nr:hypothetical protein [Bradyrhizobium sp. Rc2d]SDJ91656.1 hypothetical protein SAMN05216338_107317 [Bradyrhizobium sp. Rc2d]
MPIQLVSAYAASRLLERDRQTIERATRGLKPDAFERGKPRWRLARIVDALQARAMRTRGASTSVNDDLERQFAELEARYDAVRSAPTLDARRKMARAFFTLLADVEDAMCADAKRYGEDPAHTRLRIAEHTRVHLCTLRQALGWTYDKIFEDFVKADPKEHEDV